MPEAPDVAYPLIIWHANSEKWTDTGNDFFCHRTRSNSDTWEVHARYGFQEPGFAGEMFFTFPDEKAAMVWFVSYLHNRSLRLALEHVK